MPICVCECQWVCRIRGSINRPNAISTGRTEAHVVAGFAFLFLQRAYTQYKCKHINIYTAHTRTHIQLHNKCNAGEPAQLIPAEEQKKKKLKQQNQNVKEKSIKKKTFSSFSLNFEFVLEIHVNFWINNKQEEEEEQHERYFSLIMKFLKIFAPATPTLQSWLAPDPLLLCWGIWRPRTCLTCHKWILVYSTFQGLTTKFPFCFSSCFCGIWGTVQFAFGLSVLFLSFSSSVCSQGGLEFCCYCYLCCCPFDWHILQPFDWH